MQDVALSPPRLARVRMFSSTAELHAHVARADDAAGARAPIGLQVDDPASPGPRSRELPDGCTMGG